MINFTRNKRQNLIPPIIYFHILLSLKLLVTHPTHAEQNVIWDIYPHGNSHFTLFFQPSAFLPSEKTATKKHSRSESIYISWIHCWHVAQGSDYANESQGSSFFLNNHEAGSFLNVKELGAGKKEALRERSDLNVMRNVLTVD